MLNDEVIEKVTERLVNRIEQANEYIIRQIGKNIKKIGTVTPSKVQELVQILKYGGDYNKIVNKLAEVTRLNVKDIHKIFHEVAKNDYQFAEQFYKYRNIEYIPYKDNIALQNQINALSIIAEKNYINLTRTTALGFGMVDKDGVIVYKGLQQAYYDLLDEAVISVQQGKETFQEAMYRQIKEMGGGGLKVVYPTTYIGKDSKGQPVVKNRTMRLDSAVRMQMKTALRDLHNESQRILGEQFDSDGVEISVHMMPADDHALVQGRQFSNEEFNKFQNDMFAVSYDGIDFPPEHNGHDRRSISQYNCYHYTFAIILGISEPEYTNKELQEIIDKNEKGFEFEGKHYTMYEGSQLQRKLELEIRKAKDEQIMGRESGISENVEKAQQKISILTQKYKELSDASGLPSKLERARVSGYKRTKAIKNYKEIDYARKHNHIWHSTENLEEIIKSDELIAPSISVGKQINRKVSYGSQFIEFKPEILENVDKSTILYKGDGGNVYTKEVKQFDNLMNMLRNTPKAYNELKFNNDLESLKYIKKVYIRQDEPKKVIDLLKKNNIDYEIYYDYRIRTFKKKK